MSLDLIWRCLMALPALVMPGGFMGGGFDQGSGPEQQQMESPAEGAGAWEGNRHRDRGGPEDGKDQGTGEEQGPDTSQGGPDSGSEGTPSPSPTGSGSPAASGQCAGENDPAKAADALVCLTNQARKQNGKAAISSNSQLMAAASAKAQDMVKCGYGHEACGREANYWIQQKGYDGNCSGENIASGQDTPKEVFQDWMNSAGHRENILNASFKDIGLAQTGSGQDRMWVMELGGC